MLSNLLFFLLPLQLIASAGFFEPWGKDADLKIKQEITPSLTTPPSPLTQIMEKAILFHQNVISPADGPRSHFRPSSSAYMLLAIRRHGFFKGYVMGCDRLLRENSDKWIYRTAEIDGKVWKIDLPK